MGTTTKKAAFSIPFELFKEWYQRAKKTEPDLPNAMALATSDKNGNPSVRMVLLKGFDERGFVFYTNLESRKGEELKENPRAALLFYWKSQGRQIRVEGPIEPVTEAEADTYFATRPKGARLGAWASNQSRAMNNRNELKLRLARFTLKFAKGDIPRPPHWSGFRIKPESFEFWINRQSRLHDRVQYRLDKDKTWIKEYLFP